MKILKEKLITNVEALDILKNNSNNSKYYSKLSIENLEKFYKNIKLDNVNRLKEELLSLGFLREEQVIALINVLPEDKNDIILVLGKEIKNFNEEQLNKIYETIRKHL
ncbi:MAG: hypothetical protein RMJ17_02955 [Candidatus Aenigmarchaeota archaeon]|nr:hypothetical protein [Candidatus Aenigmarchaeota archaeon]MDW8149526.1 hypothetical protein [Candidatus Aenigmarchaeota archaeon]